MTDTFHSVSTISGHDIGPSPLSNHHDALQSQRFGIAPLIDDLQDDDGQISCVCGFSDDDGNTVACDSCNRWQHTICYYPQYEGRDLPEELQHFCVECRPQQSVDAQAAILRQRQRREQQDSFINGSRRTVAKTYKKKVRDGQTANGWPLDKTRHDRNSASPRDQQPPSKRPKTSHRTSESSTNISLTKGHSRKRTASNINHGRSQSASPERMDLYSPEFVRCYQQDRWVVTQANLHNDISVTNSLTEWLRANDEDFRDLHHHEKHDVLMRWDSDLDDIPGKAQIDIQEVSDDRNGSHDVSWKIVTVKEPVAQGAYIGELKGHVGFISQYKEDPTNRWAQLRHPEPFVFFHQSLQLCIDARNEGTELRYIRRSCRPNATLRIIVTDQTDYRFCFMALEQIDPGMEIAVAWDTADSVPYIANSLSTKDMDMLCVWVSNVLANCGPCACDTVGCLLTRFDRRRDLKRDSEDGLPPSKSVKSKKRKPTMGRHVSPLTPQLANSRSGSEIRKGEMDDEHADVRSTSGSGRDSISRDMTPTMHHLTNGGTELSERERKKLAKEEEMFRRQAEEQISRQGKKKRNSAGSNLSAAQTHAAKQTTTSSSRYTDVGVGKGLSSTTASRVHKKTKPSSPYVGNSSRVTSPTSRLRTVTYTSTAVQVDMDEVEKRQCPSRHVTQHKFVSRQQYLLRYLAEKEMKMKVSRSPSAALPTPAISEASTTSETAAPRRASGTDATIVDGLNDTVMDEAPDMVASPVLEEDSPTRLPNGQLYTAGDETELVDHLVRQDTGHDAVGRLQQLHLTMQPPAILPSTASNDSLPPMPASSAAHTMQSPSSLIGLNGPVFSPSVTASIAPSPARKKLSLSDYTRRSKAKDKDTEPKLERDSSPASTASGPIGTLATEVKPNDAVPSGNGDTKMEDVVNNEPSLSKS